MKEDILLELKSWPTGVPPAVLHKIIAKKGYEKNDIRSVILYLWEDGFINITNDRKIILVNYEKNKNSTG